MSDGPRRFGFETRQIHAGARPEPITGARQTPIYQNTSYVFEDADHAAALFNLQTYGFIYSRLTNPTVAVLEERLASLEGGRGATCCASGHAAQVLALFPFMEPGAEVVASTRLYGGSITQFGKTFRKFGWQARFVDTDDLAAVRAALTPATRALFVESLANPGGVVSDLAALADLAHGAGALLIVDNTLATPVLCRPFDWGADLVVHSLTKFLSGSGATMGGVVIDSGRVDWRQNEKFKGLADPDPAYHGISFAETFGDLAYTTHAHAVGLRDLGAALAPMNAFLTLLGLETLSLRMARHCENAERVAAFLADHPAVAWVSYAGLPGSPYRALAAKYLAGKAGAVLTFGLKGGYDAGRRLVEAVNLFSHLANIGDTRSLILHPASTTHRQLTDDQRAAAGAGPDVVRLSVGLETIDDLLADLDQALKAVRAP
ncbi:MAG: aminotransferase class I/II-fold pyridoxal phosphate-dependent enzyme [Rhodospirillaceae bacterium]|nr:aminotransferase class I/II-fold pyridoxal phosphate-dependent enzyme [Rhodospirillaceae bacterium]